MVNDRWESNSGVIADLDQHLIVEKIEVASETGALIGLGGGSNSPYLPANGFSTDTHSTGKVWITGIGKQVINQTSTLKDLRLGVVDIPMTKSGPTVTGEITQDAGGCLHFITSKPRTAAS